MSRPLQQQLRSSVRYSMTRLGGGVNAQGVSYPGGLDLVTPSLALQPGALRDCINFEVSQSGGYGRIQGYERFDGRASPSDATFTIVQVSSFANVPTVGQTLTQVTSGATGAIIAVVPGVQPYVAVTQVTAGFDFTHDVKVGATLIGTAVVPVVPISEKTNAIYVAAAADVYRALIASVPGSGAMLDVIHMAFSGVDYVYAFRANNANTAVAIYKSSGSGWVLVPFYKIVEFTAGGTATPVDGATLTQGGVTATVKRVMTRSGAWAGTAAGGFVITTPAGGNFGAGAATLTGGATVTLGGIQTAITIAVGGKFEHVKYNFAGQLITRRIYGCDGVNKAYEFDGDVYSPITTALSPDAPNHIWCHKNFLFLSQASSMFYSAVGFPFKWSAADNAGEIATGDAVTAFITLPGSQTTATLCVFMQTNTAFLYGTDPTKDFNFVLFNTGTGGIAGTAQNLFDSFVFDNLGVISLKTTLNYGNFLPNTLTKNILPFIQQKRTQVACSSIQRDKSQYRIFFKDGSALWLTLVNQQYLGPGVMQFPNAVSCIDEDDLADSTEVTYFGSSDGNGYVYQMDKGTSFDGAELPAHITCAWDSLKSPRVLKRFRAGSIEMQGSSYAEIKFGYQLGYGSALIAQPMPVPYGLNFAGVPVWDTFIWDNFTWDGQNLQPTDVDMVGTAENFQVVISSATNYIAAYNVNSVIAHYSMRRGLRV
jgi:hypothetical protein